LAAAYLAWFPSRQGARVTRAEHILSELLQDDPIRNGRYNSEGLYRIVVSPLLALYEVLPSARLVQVTGIHFYQV
jgi:hypothetical protein